MNTKLARSVVPTVEICPNCKRIAEVTPVLFADGLQDVTFASRLPAIRREISATFAIGPTGDASPRFQRGWAYSVMGISLAVAGAVTSILGVASFRRAGTTVNPIP